MMPPPIAPATVPPSPRPGGMRLAAPQRSDPHAAGTPSSSGAPADPAKLRKTAQDFEAMTIGALIAPMFETVDLSHGPFGGGAGEAAWKPVLIDHMARRIAASGGFGLTRSIEAALLRMQETRT